MILIVGAGYMAKEYAKVLQRMSVLFEAVCRSGESAAAFSASTGAVCYHGGLANLPFNIADRYRQVIIATGVETLKETARFVIDAGVKSILVEKPAGLNIAEIQELNDCALAAQARVYVAYNRRFYAAVIKAQEIIENDGGLLSCNFEFTEWAHTIEPLEKAPGVKENWFLANSTHVVDLAFHFMGMPREWQSFTSGKLKWHDPAIFAGAGVTDKEVLFTYAANWISAGRWGLELLTRKRKLILRPVEKLQEQLLGSVAVQEVAVDYAMDEQYKPGLWLQTLHFVEGDGQQLKSLEQQITDMGYFEKIVRPYSYA